MSKPKLHLSTKKGDFSHFGCDFSHIIFWIFILILLIFLIPP